MSGMLISRLVIDQVNGDCWPRRHELTVKKTQGDRSESNVINESVSHITRLQFGSVKKIVTPQNTPASIVSQ